MNKIITADNIDDLVDYLKKGIHISDLLPNGYGNYIYGLKVIANVNKDAVGGTPSVEMKLEPGITNDGIATLTLTFKNIKYSTGNKGADATSAKRGVVGNRAPLLTEKNKEGVKVLSYDSSTKTLTITPNPNCYLLYKN